MFIYFVLAKECCQVVLVKFLICGDKKLARAFSTLTAAVPCRFKVYQRTSVPLNCGKKMIERLSLNGIKFESLGVAWGKKLHYCLSITEPLLVSITTDIYGRQNK